MSLQRSNRPRPVMSTWTKERTIDFIEKYRERELLWRIGSRDYVSKIKREQAYEELLAFVKTFVLDANRDTIVAKINNLRSTWRREHKKVTYCESEDGDGVEDKYEPTLFYYYHMRFILNSELHDTPSDTDNTETQDVESQDGEQSNLSTHTTADDINNDNHDDIISERSFSPVDVKVDLDIDHDETAPTPIIPEPVPIALTTATTLTTPPPAPEEVVPIPTLTTTAPEQPTPKLVSIPTTPFPEPVPTLTIAHSQTTVTAAPPRTPKLIQTPPPPAERIPMPAAVATAVLEARKRKAQEYEARKKRRKIYHHQEEGEEEEEATGAFRSPRATDQNQNPNLNCSDAAVVHGFADTAKKELDCFGQMMTHALLGMPRDQMIHAKKMISEVIYEGQLNNLSRASAFLPSPSTNRNNGAGPLYAYLTSDDSGQYSASTSDI